MSGSFDSYFTRATGVLPYPYQRRLAGEDTGRPCDSLPIHVPTGAGRTEAVLLAWLWPRCLSSSPVATGARADFGEERIFEGV